MTFRSNLYLGLVGLASAACGSAQAPQGGTTDPGFHVGGNGSIDVNYVGGEAQLTSDQFTTIKNSSCAGWSHEGENVPAVLDFVVDTSGSMGLTSPTTGNQTKWDITHTALASAIDALPGSTAVGMLFFPNMSTPSNPASANNPLTTDHCVNTKAMIPIALLGNAGSAQRAAISQELGTVTPDGTMGTPTDDAYEYALTSGMNACALPGQRFMVLITDGQPTFLKNCIGTGRTADPVATGPIVDAITRAWGSNSPNPAVKTFIIGSPGSEAQASTGADGRGWLSQAAQVGQTPLTPTCSNSGPNYCHFDMSQVPDFAAGFSDALSQIAGQVVSCSYSMPTPPAGQTLDPTKINVVLTTGVPEYLLIQRATSSTCTTGWYLDANSNVVLCSDTCKKAKADTKSSLDLLFGCATIGNPLT
jgi:hypothetical protein